MLPALRYADFWPGRSRRRCPRSNHAGAGLQGDGGDRQVPQVLELETGTHRQQYSRQEGDQSRALLSSDGTVLPSARSVGQVKMIPEATKFHDNLQELRPTRRPPGRW